MNLKLIIIVDSMYKINVNSSSLNWYWENLMRNYQIETLANMSTVRDVFNISSETL